MHRSSGRQHRCRLHLPAVQAVFTRGVFRVYLNDDLVRCEMGGALKNVIAIAGWQRRPTAQWSRLIAPTRVGEWRTPIVAILYHCVD
jgi:hypothetical protein